MVKWTLVFNGECPASRLNEYSRSIYATRTPLEISFSVEEEEEDKGGVWTKVDRTNIEVVGVVSRLAAHFENYDPDDELPPDVTAVPKNSILRE
jgi:hypothetical protein